MRYLELSLPTPAENLALDEALLDEAELGDGPGEVLRFWEPPHPMIVVGRSSRVTDEVNLAHVEAAKVPVLRRCSGGAAIVAGPGCLMYAVVLSYELRPFLRAVDQAHCFALKTLKRALEHVAPGVEIQGTSDLTRHHRKFSGNSLRCKRDHLLYHGTILYDFPLDLIDRYLGSPPRQPDYRQQRAHTSFVDNFPGSVDKIRRAVRDAWSATEPLDPWPEARTKQLVARRYSLDDWNRRI